MKSIAPQKQVVRWVWTFKHFVNFKSKAYLKAKHTKRLTLVVRKYRASAFFLFFSFKKDIKAWPYMLLSPELWRLAKRFFIHKLCPILFAFHIKRERKNKGQDRQWLVQSWAATDANHDTTLLTILRNHYRETRWQQK